MKAPCLTLMAMVCTFMVALPILAQKTTKQGPLKSKAHLEENAALFASPVMPIEVKVGYHRNEPALFVTVKNLDQKRSVTMVACSLMVMDSIKLSLQHVFYNSEFKFAYPIKPLNSETAVLTKSDDGTVDWKNRVIGNCRGYVLDSRDKTDDAFLFSPVSCSDDILVVRLNQIGFSDNTEWVSPAFR